MVCVLLPKGSTMHMLGLMTESARYAICEHPRTTGDKLLTWQGADWAARDPWRLMGASEAARELIRLRKALPHAADRIVIVDRWQSK
jgi:hypothetical protein